MIHRGSCTLVQISRQRWLLGNFSSLGLRLELCHGLVSLFIERSQNLGGQLASKFLNLELIETVLLVFLLDLLGNVAQLLLHPLHLLFLKFYLLLQLSFLLQLFLFCLL